MERRLSESTYAVILAGGVGKRFWPLSRRNHPKQFLRLAQESGGAAATDRGSMLQNTVDRIAPLVPPDRILVVAGADHEALVREHLPELPEGNILCEPTGRNTAAAVAWAAHDIRERDPDAAMVVLAADHHIINPETFRTAVARAIRAANDARGLVLFGLKPSGPMTQYGYIVPDAEPEDAGPPALYRVKRFHEKPPEATAREYLESGPCFWNSGMFAWRADTVLKELARNAADVAVTAEEAVAQRDDTEAFAEAYEAIPSISIDHALLEHAQNVLVVDSGIERVDLGTWATVPAIWPPDAEGNAVRGDVLVLDASDTVAHSERTFVATIGTKELVVVVTDDVVFVCDRKRAKEAGDIVKRLESGGREDLV